MITFYVQKRKLSCHRAWQMTHCLFKYTWSASRGDSALLSYKVMCLLDRSGSMNWQPSSSANFLFCVFSCLFTAAVFHFYMPTKTGFHQNTPQHPKFWNTEIKKKQKENLLLLTLLSPKDIKNHYIPQTQIYKVLMTPFPHSPSYQSSHLNASLYIHWWSPIAPKLLWVLGKFCGGLHIS